MALPAGAVAGAKMAGSAVGQVGIQLALEKAMYKKEVEKTTKETESAFSKSFNKVEKANKSAFSKMGNVVSNTLSKVKDNVSQTFKKVSNTIKVAMVAASAFAIKFGKDSIQAASETQAAWTGLFSIVNGTGKSFSEAKGFLEEYTKDGLIPLTDAITSYKNLAARGYSTEQIEQTMKSLKDAAAFGRQSSYSYGEAIKSATEGLKNENSILVDNAGVTKNVAKMWDEYAASIGTTANNLTQQQKIQAEVQGILEETKFQTGDAAKYADTYSGKIAKLSTAFYNLKVTVGQVLTPIIELLLPVITTAINGLTKMFNKLKSIMSVFGLEMKEYIGGETSSAISSATDSTSALSNGLDNTGDAAAKAAKKINKAFAGVDEINVLNTKNDSSSGSSGLGGSSGIGEIGGSDISLGGAFEDTQSKVTQNLEWLSRTAYDWGVAFGESINKGLEMIPWSNIQSTVTEVVTKIAQFLNGAVSGLDWYLLGTTFGEGFNTIIYGLNAWYKTFDWSSLGTSLGEGVNGIIESVNWSSLGEYFALKFNSIFEILSNFFDTVKWGELGTNLIEGLNTTIETLDFDEVGETLENGINGAIDLMFNAISTFDATKAGEQFASLINNISEAIKNIDWSKLGETFSEGSHKIFETLRTTIKETNWGELVDNVITGIVDWVRGIKILELLGDTVGLLWDVGVALIEGLWGGIKSILKNAGGILYDILVKPIVDGVKALFGIKSPSTVFAEIGKFLIEGLWQGISNAKTWMIEKWNTVKGWFSNITKEAKVQIKQKWADIKEKWTDLTKNAKDKVADMKAKVASKWGDLKEKWNNITKNIKDKTASMKAKIGTTWSSLKSKWQSLMSNFQDKTITIKTKIGEVIGNIKSTINDKVIKPINNKLPSIFPKIPYLAQGGWFDKNNPTLAVVGDNKHEPEITAPESKIYEQTKKAVEDAGGTNKQQIEIVLNVKYEDGKSIIKKINNTQIQDGKITLLV